MDNEKMNKESEEVKTKNEENETKENAEKAEDNEKVENIEKTENTDSKENKEEPKDELTLAKEKIADLEDKYKRLLAEFDNFRKRSEKETFQMFDTGLTSTIIKILPIVDNLERAFANVPEDIKTNPFVEGIEKTYKQVLKVLEDMQIKPFESKGKSFDANLHNAVMTDETSDAEVDTITEELQKGYMYKDEVLRHAMVKVKK